MVKNFQMVIEPNLKTGEENCQEMSVLIKTITKVFETTNQRER